MTKPLFILSAYIAVSVTVFSQTRYDSLMNLANQTHQDSSRVILLNEASIALRESDSNKALEIAQQARMLAEKLQFNRGIAMTLANIGWINYRQGIYSEALSLSMEALKIDRQLGDNKEISNCLNNIGAITFEQKKFDDALKSFKEAYAYSTKINYTIGMNRSLNNIAFCFLRLKKLDSARHYTQRSINEFTNSNFAPFSKRLLGDIALEEKNYGEALGYYEDCLRSAVVQKNNFLVASTQYRIAKTYNKLKNPDKALQILFQNIEVAKKYNYKSELESSYLVMAESYSLKNDLAKAMEYQTLHYQLKDSLSEQRRGELTEIIQSKYQSEIKNAQIELLTRDSLIKGNELKAQRILMYVGIGILIVLAILIFNLLQSNQRNKMANSLLSKQNELINDQSNQLEALNKTKDKILSIISHDMRSPLAGLKGIVNLMSTDSISQEEFIEVSKNLRKNLDYVYNDLDNLLHWANAQVKGIRPQFERVSVQEVVMEKVNLFAEVAKNKSIQIDLNIAANLYVWADINHLRLVFRNLLSNAIKFSAPHSKIEVNAFDEGKIVRMEVKDFGIGMSEEEIQKLFMIENHFTRMGTQNEKGIGLGLILVKEFVETNKGSIAVQSHERKGTTFTVTMESQPA